MPTASEDRRAIRARRQIRRRRLLLGLTAVAICSSAGGAAAAGSSSRPASGGAPTFTAAPPVTRDLTCPSPALGGALPVRVYLPTGYLGGRLRYPVVYFLHGLPAGPTTYQAFGFVAAALQSSGHAAILVSPQGARADNDDREYLDWSAAEDWPRAISRDLPRCIDRRFRTIRRRRGRALVGLSAGGFGAFNIGLRALDTFAALESWSGYFYATDPSGLHRLKLGSPSANAAAQIPGPATIRDDLRRFPSFLGFYVGSQDSRFLQPNVELDGVLTRSRIAHVFRVYPGGHSTALWAAMARHWLGMALRRLAGPR